MAPPGVGKDLASAARGRPTNNDDAMKALETLINRSQGNLDLAGRVVKTVSPDTSPHLQALHTALLAIPRDLGNISADDLARLPGGAFLKSFINKVAVAQGIDPKTIAEGARKLHSALLSAFPLFNKIGAIIEKHLTPMDIHFLTNKVFEIAQIYDGMFGKASGTSTQPAT